MNMKKNENPNPINGKGKVVGLVLCFAAVIVMVGVYTFNSYQRKLDEELTKSKQLAESIAEEENQETTANDIVNEADTEDEEGDDIGTDGTSSGSGETGLDGGTATDNATGDALAGQETGGYATSAAFGEESILDWPASGSIVLDYSMDHTIYFPTLAEYKYNPALVITGTVGEEILAGASGTVTSVDQTAQTGVTVTLDLGNGYTAVYGQLKEVPVSVGEYVSRGSLIGYLSEPTKYYSSEGPNLYFAMTKDGVAINPMDFME